MPFQCLSGNQLSSQICSIYNHCYRNMALFLFVLQYRFVMSFPLSIGLFQYGSIFILFFKYVCIWQSGRMFQITESGYCIIDYDHIRSICHVRFCCCSCMTCWRGPLLVHGNYKSSLVYFGVIQLKQWCLSWNQKVVVFSNHMWDKVGSSIIYYSFFKNLQLVGRPVFDVFVGTDMVLSYPVTVPYCFYLSWIIHKIIHGSSWNLEKWNFEYIERWT